MRKLNDDSPTDDPIVADPEEIGDGLIGSPVRDGAVDPREGDFLAPLNAGEANPHGPEVVSPEVHASQGVRPIRPGEVHVGDPDAQADAELEHAAAATDGTPIDDGAPVVDEPAGNASKKAWAEYARAQGASQDEVDNLGRDELRERYGSPDEG